MDDGYKNWPIVRKLLIDNRLQHSALLAHAIDVSEQIFVMRARHAYRLMESRIDDAVEVANDVMGRVANALQDEEDRASQPKGEETPVKKPKIDPGIAVTLDRVTDEPTE